MKTYIKSINHIQWLLILLMGLIVSSCNKDGDETIVIQDGTPSVSTLVIGKWKPTRKQKVDKNNPGNVKEEPVTNDDSELEFFEDGTGSSSNNPNERYEWSADDENGTIYFNGYRWYITTLSKGLLIIYRIEGDYLIIYYYLREGAFEGDDDEGGNSSSGDCVYVPWTDGPVITKIITTNQKTGSVETRTFGYDDKKRISKYSIKRNNSETVYTYSYDKNSVNVNENGRALYKCTLGDNGYIKELGLSTSNASVWFDYTKDYLSNVKMMNNSFSPTFSYNNLTKMTSYLTSATTNQIYEYTTEVNNTSVDLNGIYTSCNVYEAWLPGIGNHHSVLAPFDFCGKRSQNLSVTEVYNSQHTYVFDFGKDDFGRIIKIISKDLGSINNRGTVVHDIYYK